MKTDEIEKLLAEATPGPWDVDPHGIDDCMGDVWLGEDVRVCENATAADARLIAMAPDLAAEVERLREALQNAIDHHVAALAVVRGNLDDSYSAMAEEMESACNRWRAALEGRE